MTLQTTLTRTQLSQLVEEYQELRDWTTIRDFCNQAYGEGVVARMDVETYGEYNDEGSTNYYVENLYAVSSTEEEARFDFSLPFWQEVLKDQELTLDKIDPDDTLYLLREWYPKDKQTPWVRWEEIPCDVHEGSNESYDLTSVPPINFPVAFTI